MVKGVLSFSPSWVNSRCSVVAKPRETLFRHTLRGVLFIEENAMFGKKQPEKRVVIAGCRDYDNYEQAKAYIDSCLSNVRKENQIIIVSGGARGADALGERYAKENGFQVEKYPADWETYGKSAGPRRNEQMAQASDYVICFWDGKSRGTKSMIEFAKKHNKPLRIQWV